MEFKMAQQIPRFILCILGILLSLYAYYVETTKEVNPGYQAFCDIGQSISCSKVFTSKYLSCYQDRSGDDLRGLWLFELTYHPVTGKYGRGFGMIAPIFGQHSILNQPNSVFGVLFYCLQLLFSQMLTPGAATFLLVTSVLANFGSVYLGWILYFVLEDFCLVCVSTYIVNFLILVVNVLHRRYVLDQVAKKAK
ncbi:vitamin K epoxide reductase complex subunit 1-like protein 1 isoform X1 [Amphiura filiformis]|uniref:vitamin K epoxide reductase complex subunit 1-like protein 1 isoform X1 n=1 Tax=Amphiura filiformis TaxID=82378 RepID=UPI003B20CB63